MESESIKLSNEEIASSMLPPATGSANINVGTGERILSTFIGAAAAVYGLRHIGSFSGLSLAVTGGFLLYRGATGYCAVNNAAGRNSNNVTRKTSAMEVSGIFTVNKPKAEVYNFWRKLENLPLFMKHLEEVKEEDSVHSTWKAMVPGGFGTVSWKATITEDRPQELLSWASQPGSTIDNAGEVTFKDAPNDRGTEVRVCMTYRLPAGDVGTIAGKLFNPAVEKMIREDLRRFKSILETGEIPVPGVSPSNVATGDYLTTPVNTGSYSSPATGEAKPKRTRTKRTPEGSSGRSETFRDSTLQSSPSNDSNQPTEKQLLDPDRTDFA